MTYSRIYYISLFYIDKIGAGEIADETNEITSSV